MYCFSPQVTLPRRDRDLSQPVPVEWLLTRLPSTSYWSVSSGGAGLTHTPSKLPTEPGALSTMGSYQVQVFSSLIIYPTRNYCALASIY